MDISDLSDWIIANEPTVRLSAFLAVFGTMALWELAAERRQLRAPKGSRWFANLSLVAVNTLVLRLLSPIAVMGMAAVAAERGWGLLNNVEVPYPVAVVVSVVGLGARAFQDGVAHGGRRRALVALVVFIGIIGIAQVEHRV